jgi:pullulanase
MLEYGIKYSKTKTIITLYTPMHESVLLRLYKDGASMEYKEVEMKKTNENVFEIELEGDLHGKYYTFIIEINGVVNEMTDPYSISTSANGNRSAIVDIRRDEPEGFREYNNDKPLKKNEIIIYEFHIVDTTANKKFRFVNKGKYLGVLESLEYKGEVFGLNHLKELGITHVHLLPINDFASADELSSSYYNWGYDPEHYNAPEGSYSNTPKDSLSRIRELKTLIHGLHKEGIKVILDVVYNHTYRSKSSNFFNLFGSEFYRIKNNEFSNGSGCGNELNTENPIVKKFIIDSLKFWVEEYLVDGFRFDLMALIDKKTMYEIEKELKAIKPNIFLYGEPWAANATMLNKKLMSLKGFQKSKNISVFNDDFRDAIKGNGHGLEKGYVAGNVDVKKKVMLGLLGSINYSIKLSGFCDKPTESINYFSCHDDLIVFDRLNQYKSSLPGDVIRQMNKFAFSIMLTSQGVPFIHQGTEFLRTKFGILNTYNIASDVNYLDWTYKNKNYEFFRYVKALIGLRKRFSNAFFDEASEIRKRIKFYNTEKNHIEFHIKIDDEKYDELVVIHNPAFDKIAIDLEKNREWYMFSDGHTCFDDEVKIENTNNFKVKNSSTTILGRLKSN